MHSTSLVEPSESLFTTKLYVPPVQPYHIVRPRLVQQLNSMLQYKLTLLSAPAGSGKTTALIDWHRLRGSSQPLAWLSLDNNDNNPVRFWQHIIAALKTVHVNINEQLLQLFNVPQPPPLEALLLMLLHAISQVTQHFILVLDDYDVIHTQAIHDSLAFLLDRLPPQIHIAISSRFDPPLPLSRLRIRRQLKEVRAGDLRFTQEEAAIFFNSMMSLRLSQTAIDTLVARTEGWSMGLQLAAFSMRGRKDHSAFLLDFTGSKLPLIDYLLDKMLHQQSEQVQDFLLFTAILDRLHGSLCDELLDQTNSQKLLENLALTTPFIASLDKQKHWYRYHHVIANVMRTRLEQHYADRLPQLHLRASYWYEQAELPHEAIHHALAAADYERTATLIEHNSKLLLQNGNISMLQTWLATLPNDFLRSHLQLNLIQAWMHALLNQWETAEMDLQQVEELLDKTKAPDITAQIASIRSGISTAQHDITGTIEFSRQALAQLPEDALLTRGFVSRNIGISSWLKGDVLAATQALANAIDYNHASNNIYAALIVSCDLAFLQMMQGQLQKANTTYEQVLEYISGADLQFLPVIQRARQGLGTLLYEWNELDAATDNLLVGMDLTTANENIQVTLNSYVTMARIKQVHGDEEEAWRLLQEIEDYIYSYNYTHLVPTLSMHRARLWLIQGNSAEAGEWVVASGLSFDDPLNHLHTAEYLTLARVYIAQRKLVLALGFLARLRQAAETDRLTGNIIEIALLEALAWQEQGDVQQALTSLVDALMLARPEGYIRIFVDEGAAMEALLTKALEMRPSVESLQKVAPGYIRTLLSTIKQERLWREMPGERNLLPATLNDQDDPVEPPLEPLTEREIEVLRLVAAGLSNRSIAEHMAVSSGTVKVHLHNIHNKLSVHNRTEAVARARDLNLLQ